MFFFGLLLVLIHYFHGVAAYFPQGTITVPANGTAIAPGANFDFTYNVHSDYCVSSYNFTVWLLTSPPESILAGTATGHFFGRFAAATYPKRVTANPNPSNPVPPQLTMPNFSKSPGGFGVGASRSNAVVYLAVIEEWDTCSPTFGKQLTVAVNNLVYNATKVPLSRIRRRSKRSE
ncbi:hypothetical protein BD410DRAFT_721613 [Rickenella mellea]|uniref:Uncharacterized protein n=1 Tax=Rickenella mellea TaxID=50990 RepID=A0A4Y7Q6M1_9AGAM|nr:hypothetical protein BD410DRAFT_721613 [Rickenella mellea]